MRGPFTLQLSRESFGLCCASPESRGMAVFAWEAIEDKEIL